MRKKLDFSLLFERCNNFPGADNEKIPGFLIVLEADVTKSGFD
jgi:hypothetical protein